MPTESFEHYQDYFRGKTILVTGGTGSFGHQITSRLLPLGPKRIIVFSRDEAKQYSMHIDYPDNRVLELIIGDVRDYASLEQAMRGADIVFHAAALKQVPNCESRPFQAVLTNVIGAENVRRAAVAHGVESVLAISTDKAVKPVNVMGMTKALQERIFLSQWSTNGPRVVCVRYGNVLGSRGSIMPLLKREIERGRSLPVTDKRMTRFLLTLDQAILLVFRAAAFAQSGSLLVKKMPASLVTDLQQVYAQALTGRIDYPTHVIGIRPGEKIHEVLVSEEELVRALETEDYFEIRPYGAMDGPSVSSFRTEYTSENTTRLETSGIRALLVEAGWLPGLQGQLSSSPTEI